MNLPSLTQGNMSLRRYLARALLAVIPMQDVLGLDSEDRMNLPGTSGNNWKWRFTWDQVDPDLSERLRRRVVMYGRGA